MKSAAVILFLLCALPAKAAWSVNSSPVLTDAGINIKNSEQKYLTLFYTLSDGTPHVGMGFVAPGGVSTTYYQMWDVNLSNSVSRVRDISFGLPSISASVLTSSNTLVLGSLDAAYVAVYDVIGGTNIYISAKNTGSSYVSGALGTDGQAYLGDYPNCVAWSYNPADNTLKNWGKFDTALAVTAYAHSVGADSNYIYGVIREAGGTQNWYLSTIEKANTNKVVYWKTGDNGTTTVKASTNGNWYVQQGTNGTPSERWWVLTNGVPSVIAGDPGDTIPYWRAGNVNRDQTTWESEKGWVVDAALGVASASGSIPTATMGFRKTADTNLTSVVETNGWNLLPGTIDIVQPWLGDSLFWVVNAYGPVGSFVPGGTTTILGNFKGTSTYRVLQSSLTDVYFGGYHRVTMRWNPTLPWTREPLMPDYSSTNINPFNAVTSLGKYHYQLAKGNNGRIFIGSHWELDGTGGELGWYDPVSNTSGSERTTFLNDDVKDLKPAESASKLVYASNTTNIFVWDVATFTKLTNFSLPSMMNKVVEYENGKMFGVGSTNTFGFTTAGVQLWSNNIPATSWGGTATMTQPHYELTLGPDNFIWLCAGGNLLRINPVDGSYSNILTTTTNYNTVFDGMDCYLFGSKMVMKISNLLTNIASASTNSINAVTANIGSIVLAQ